MATTSGWTASAVDTAGQVPDSGCRSATGSPGEVAVFMPEKLSSVPMASRVWFARGGFSPMRRNPDNFPKGEGR